MSDYTITFISCHTKNEFTLPLFMYEGSESDIIDSNQCVYDNYDYEFSIVSKLNEPLNIESVYVNDEDVDCIISNGRDNIKIIPQNSKKIFLGCYGIVRLSVIINEIEYTSPYISVFIKEENYNKDIDSMIEYIYDNCENYLYEEHKNNRMHNGIFDNGETSVQAKIQLLNEIVEKLKTLFPLFKNSPYSKLINKNVIAPFEKLRDITPNTMVYISTHVDELQRVNINSGIKFNNQFFQPKTTLVKSVQYTTDIYENRVIVGFILKIIVELGEMLSLVEKSLLSVGQCRKINGYIESKYFIYQRSRIALEKYRTDIIKLQSEFNVIYFSYQKILNTSKIQLTSAPEFTNVFKNIIQYRQMFEIMYKWFNSGRYNLAKEEFILSFISTSKIYEYYCLLKINSIFITNGYEFKNGYIFTYSEDKYYKNTCYNNTFNFCKNDVNITVYFQPKIYSGISKEDRNKIKLFRCSSFGITRTGKNKKKCYYTPDYLIKINNSSGDIYYVLDAKLSQKHQVIKHQLQELIYKYLFSLSSFDQNDSIMGLLILCGKFDDGFSTNIRDISEEIGIDTIPFVKFIDFGVNCYNETDILSLTGSQ